MNRYIHFSSYCKKLSFLEIIPYLNDYFTWKRYTAIDELLKRKNKHNQLLNLAFLFVESKNWKLREVGACFLSGLTIQSFHKKNDQNLSSTNCSNNIHDKIVDTLIHLTHDQRIAVKSEALAGIADKVHDNLIDPCKVFHLFKNATNSRYVKLRLRVAMALPFGISEDYKVLKKLIQDKDEMVREWAIFAFRLTQYDTPELRELVLNVLAHDPSPYTQEEAASLLIKLKEPRAIPMIQDLVYKNNKLNSEILSAMYDYPDENSITILESIIPINSYDKEDIQESIEEIKEKLNVDGNVLKI